MAGSRSRCRARAAKGTVWRPRRNTLNAPRVLRDIEGDFIADLKVGGTFKPVGGSANPNGFPFVGAGLLLWSDAGNYIRLERAAIVRNDQLIPYVLFQERRNRLRMPPDGGMPHSRRVDRAPPGTQRRPDHRLSSVSTATIGEPFLRARFAFPAKLKLGVAAISSSREPFIVTLENFRVLRPE